jgi:hypothetical protein
MTKRYSEDYLKEAKLNTWQKLNFHIRSWTNKKFGIWDVGRSSNT